MIDQKQLDELNGKHIEDFAIDRFVGDTLTIRGSFDLAYYTQVMLTFQDVVYVQLPAYFTEATFTHANAGEIESLKRLVPIEPNEFALTITADGMGGEFQQKFFIVAAGFEIEYQGA